MATDKNTHEYTRIPDTHEKYRRHGKIHTGKNTHGCTRIHTPRKYTRQGKIHTDKIHTEYTRQFAPRLGQTQIHTEMHTDAHGMHTLTHFWQKRNCPNPQALVLLEGFAEWTAYKLAEHNALHRAMLSIRRNVAEPYHTGFHAFLGLEQKIGIQGVIKYARTETGLSQ